MHRAVVFRSWAAWLPVLTLIAAACSSSDSTPAATATIGSAAASSVPAATATRPPAATSATSVPSSTAPDPQNATYTVEGKPVTLVIGVSEVAAAPGSASKVTTKYFGNQATGDLNADGKPDIAFVLTQNSGGSGTFFYVAADLSSPAGYAGTNAVLLGDRIAPQTTEIRNAEVVVNYADRRPGEPMTTPPSVGVTKYLRIVDGKLVER